MSNIFGKELEGYQHLVKLKEKGLLDRHLNAAKSCNKPLIFDGALGNYRTKVFKDADIDSAAGFGWLQSNLQAVATEVVEIMFLEYRLPGLIPIKRNVNEGALSYSYIIKNQYGEANFIDTYGTNANTSGVSYDMISTPILQGGADAIWSIQDVRAAMFAAVALDTDTIYSATVSCLNHLERVAFFGQKGKKGFESGLLNNPDVPQVKATTPLQTAKDATVEINNYLNQVIDSTNTIMLQRKVKGLSVYMPYTHLSYLATTKYAANADKTMLEYLKVNNAWTAFTGVPVVFKPIVELKENSKEKKPARMAIVFNDDKVMEMAQPIQPRVIGIENKLRHYYAPLEYSLSPLNFKIPGTCLYVDGI